MSLGKVRKYTKKIQEKEKYLQLHAKVPKKILGKKIKKKTVRKNYFIKSLEKFNKNISNF